MSVMGRSRQNPLLKDEMIDTILYFLPSIPGNVIAFFPSYGYLNDCWYEWERNGQMNSVRAIKEVFKEDAGMTNENFTMIVKSLKQASYGRGAVLFAVCRGKASEGIDFSDAMCRCVIITGVPYPPFTDKKVQMRRQYLDAKSKQQDVFNERTRKAYASGNQRVPRAYPDLPLASANNLSSKPMSGNEWYAISAHRAVNQSVGRAIRHKDDYGLILLMDERFTSPSSVEHLSKWMQPFYRPMENTKKLLTEVEEFFRLNAKIAPPPKREVVEETDSSAYHSFSERLRVSQEEKPKEAPKASLNVGLWKKLKASKMKLGSLSQEPKEVVEKKASVVRSLDSDSEDEAALQRKKERREQFCSQLKTELKPAPERTTPPAKGIKRYFHSDEVKRPIQTESGALKFDASEHSSARRNLFGVKRKSWVCLWKRKYDNDVIRTRAGKSH